MTGVQTCALPILRILNITEQEILQKPAVDFFVGENEWLMERITKVQEEQQTDTFVDASYQSGDETLSLNGTVAPLISTDEKKLGVMVMLEDISTEKRMKSTMSRYMDPGLADQLMEGNDNLGEIGRRVV